QLYSPPPLRAPPFPYTTLFRSRRGRTTDFRDDGALQAQDGAHQTSSGFYRCLHVAPTLADQGHGIRKRQPLGGYHRRVLPQAVRSEEHTSELQSRVDLVCRLLL